mmetsp:Transcript_23306/g.35783  ORF Transcript_23306/g.35783 Transcript_23306/m.35783 type:complete len:103 (-) Transcript_23306:1813-2121(-)
MEHGGSSGGMGGRNASLPLPLGLLSLLAPHVFVTTFLAGLKHKRVSEKTPFVRYRQKFEDASVKLFSMMSTSTSHFEVFGRDLDWMRTHPQQQYQYSGVLRT